MTSNSKQASFTVNNNTPFRQLVNTFAKDGASSDTLAPQLQMFFSSICNEKPLYPTIVKRSVPRFSDTVKNGHVLAL
jgi:hypothetical protein